MDNEASFNQYSADTFINAALLHWACNMCKIPVFVVSNQQMFVLLILHCLLLIHLERKTNDSILPEFPTSFIHW